MTDLASLLAPISTGSPCGDEPPENDSSVREIRRSLVVKASFESAAKEPDWSAVKEKCLEAHQRFKHLEVCTALTLAWLQLEGLDGFHRGLRLILGLLETFWEEVHPRLQGGDARGAMERVNAFRSLYTANGTVGDQWLFGARLLKQPLLQTDGPSYSADDLRQAVARDKEGKPLDGIKTLDEIKSEVRRNLGGFNAAVARMAAIRATARQIDTVLAARLTMPPKSDWLLGSSGTLKVMEEALAAVAPPGFSVTATPAPAAVESSAAAPASGTVSANSPPATGSSAPTPVFAGPVASSEDAIRLINLVCEYYQQRERSSPVPLLLGGARRLIDMPYAKIATMITRDDLNVLLKIAGEKADPAE